MPLAAFLATDRRQAILNQQAFSEKPTCLLFIDIAGFSALTRKMVAEQQARRGTEALLELLNQLYAELIDGIHAYEGSVIYFAGDALTCSFADAEAALRVAFHLQALMQDKDVALKLSLSYGQVQRHSFGQQPAFDVPLGEAVEVLNVANEVARANDIIISQTMLPLLSPEFSQQLQLSPVEDAPALARVQLAIPLSLPLPVPTSSEISLDNSLLQPYVPAFLQQQSHFITELRPCVTLFCQISYAEQATGVARLLHDFIPAVQACLAQQGGKILEFTTDDKGHVIYAPFGAPVAYKDDSIRACRSALAIINLQKDFPPLHLRLALHQGILRTGFIGSEQRRSYAMTGQATNATAAMMMQADPNSILISEALAQQLPASFIYGQEAQLIHLKEAQQLISYPLQAEQVITQLRSEVMVGREAELEQLSHYIHAKEKIALQVIAEAGLGKSLLLRQAMHQHRDIPFYIGEAEPQQQQTAYYIWRFILRNFLHITSDDSEVVSQQLRQLLPTNLHERLSLLSPVLAIALPEQNFAKNLSPEVRQQATSALIMEILEHVASQHFFVLVLEDCHWLDDLSRQLLEPIVARKSRNFALLLLSRQPVLDDEEVEKLELSTLSPSAAQALIQSHLGEQLINQSLVNLILEKAEGNPFYLEELLHYIKAHDKLEHIEELPATLHSLVLSRFDSLPSAQKTLLRVASVVGRYFNSQHLREYAEELQEIEAWQDKLHELLDKSFLLKEINRQQGIESDYFFKHILNQEIIYTSLSYRFREKLHEAYADFVLENLEHELDILAYHYKRSANEPKAIRALQNAADASFEQLAETTAIQHFDDVVSLQLKQPHINTPQVIKNKLNIAISYHRINEWDIAEEKYQEVFVFVEASLLQGDERAYYQALIKGAYARFLGDMGKSHLAEETFQESLTLHEVLQQENNNIDNAADILQLKHNWFIQHFIDSELEKAKNLGKEVIQEAERLGDMRTYMLAQVYYLRCEQRMGNIQIEAIYALLAKSEEKKYPETSMFLYELLGMMTAKEDKSTTFASFFIKARNIAQELGDVTAAAALTCNMGMTYGYGGYYREAIRYLFEAIERTPKVEIFGQSYCYLNISYFAFLADDLYYLEESLAQASILIGKLQDDRRQRQLILDASLLELCQAFKQDNLALLESAHRQFITLMQENDKDVDERFSVMIVVYLMICGWKLRRGLALSEPQKNAIQLLGYLNVKLDDNPEYFKRHYHFQLCEYYYEDSRVIFQQYSDEQAFARAFEQGSYLSQDAVKSWVLNVG